MTTNFNEHSKSGLPFPETPGLKPGEDPLEHAKRTGERTRFVHKRNPASERDYQIFEYDFKKGDYDLVGDYTLIKTDEPTEITEKKLINLMSLLNKKNDLIDLSNLTNSRVLFTVVPEAQSGDQTKIILKDYDGSGVSKDNAVFTIRKGVFNGNR